MACYMFTTFTRKIYKYRRLCQFAKVLKISLWFMVDIAGYVFIFATMEPGEPVKPNDSGHPYEVRFASVLVNPNGTQQDLNFRHQ